MSWANQIFDKAHEHAKRLAVINEELKKNDIHMTFDQLVNFENKYFRDSTSLKKDDN
jgi:hypothetical protein